MPSQRRKDPVHSRRRRLDDGDDDGSVVNDAVDDSLSEGSIPSDADDDGDADDSDLSDSDVNVRSSAADLRTVKSNGSANMRAKEADAPNSTAPTLKKSKSDPAGFETTRETEAMLNGLKLSEDDAKAEVIDYDTLNQKSEATIPKAPTTKPKTETLADRRRREHEEYKQKRDTDPAFIPTRGAFFMHDSRHGNEGFYRGSGRGRGRGRGGFTTNFPAIGSVASNEPTNSPWSHDLHETLLQAPMKSTAPLNAPSGPANPTGAPLTSPRPAVIRSFSTTQVLGKVQMRVFLPAMKEPSVFSDITVKRYTKLPNHRPPLRRDKPVRMSIPEHTVRYIFPSVDRSFIFIPRALRPNQQGFGRGRGRGVGSHGGYSSRRTSIYNGSIYNDSMYSPSIAMSRRSSIAREGMASPAGSFMSSRPVVRLPPGAQAQHTRTGTPIRPGVMSGGGTPAFGIPPGPAVMVQPVTYRENWPANLQMHQPRPQKAISVTGIEYPATTFQAPIAADQLPFHHQVPAPVTGPVLEHSALYTHSRQGSFSNPPPAAGTPLSNIPERAIHAQPFQPYQVDANQYAAQPYYYAAASPAGGQYAAGTVIAPMYVQTPQQGAYILPTLAAPGPHTTQQSIATPAGFVPHEQNGMVYYIDPNQMYMPAEGYAQPSYGVPAAEGYYYPPQTTPGAVYYPSQ